MKTSNHKHVKAAAYLNVFALVMMVVALTSGAQAYTRYTPAAQIQPGDITNTMLANSAVTSAKISDGTIVNADISAAAAIDASKVSGLTTFTATATAAESLSPYDGIIIGDGTTATITSFTGTIGYTNWGNASATEAIAQNFPGADVKSPVTHLILYFRKISTPTDNVLIELRSTSETGTLLATSSLPMAGLSGSGAEATFALSNPVHLLTGTTYYIVVKRSGALDGSNFAQLGNGPVATYTSGSESTYVNGVWTANTPASSDMYFKIVRTLASGQVYKANTGTSTAAVLVSGLSAATTTIGSTATLYLSGLITNSGWNLTPGKLVYATDTPGALSNTAGTNTAQVGRAVSATSIFINPE